MINTMLCAYCKFLEYSLPTNPDETMEYKCKEVNSIEDIYTTGCNRFKQADDIIVDNFLNDINIK